MKALSVFLLVLLAGIVLQSCGQSSEQMTAAQPVGGEQDKDSTLTETRTILFFGNSLTAGYGVEPSEAFPARIQEKIDSLKLPYRVINAGLSGETSAGGKNRIGWVLRQPVDIFVLELGANDGLRGIDLQDTRTNLQAILDTVKTYNPTVQLLIAGMMIPPNMGTRYTSEFQRIFPELAEANKAILIPFLLEGVAGEAALNQQDGIHPTPKGHAIVASNVWDVLQPLLESHAPQ